VKTVFLDTIQSAVNTVINGSRALESPVMTVCQRVRVARELWCFERVIGW